MTQSSYDEALNNDLTEKGVVPSLNSELPFRPPVPLMDVSEAIIPVALVIDVSESMRGTSIGMVTRAANKAVAYWKENNIPVYLGIILFGDKAEPFQDFVDIREINQEFDFSQYVGGRTNLYDGIKTAISMSVTLKSLFSEIGTTSKKVQVLGFTDGAHTNSSREIGELRDELSKVVVKGPEGTLNLTFCTTSSDKIEDLEKLAPGRVMLVDNIEEAIGFFKVSIMCTAKGKAAPRPDGSGEIVMDDE